MMGGSQDINESVQTVIPKRAFVSLKQYLNRPCEAIVKEGAHVLTGDIIGRGKGNSTPPLHSPVTGTVDHIKPYPDVFGEVSQTIVIDSDGLERWAEPQPEKVLHETIFGSGIVETYSLQRPNLIKGADTIILNGTDHRPWVFVDRALMGYEGENVLRGLEILMEASGAKRGLIGVNSSDIDYLERLRFDLSKERIQFVPLKMFYTRGMDRLLKRDLSRQLEIDLGRSIITRASVARAVYMAVEKGRPYVENYVSVYGAVQRGAPLVRIGSTIQDVVEALRGYKGTPERIYLNSPMTGVAQYTDSVPLVKSTYGVTIEYEVTEESVGPCIRCARCVDVCPVNILPNMLALFSRKQKFKECKGYHVFACIECGYCSYTCPSKIPILQLIRYAKTHLEGS